jgi:hypothetical protein
MLWWVAGQLVPFAPVDIASLAGDDEPVGDAVSVDTQTAPKLAEREPGAAVRERRNDGLTAR